MVDFNLCRSDSGYFHLNRLNIEQMITRRIGMHGRLPIIIDYMGMPYNFSIGVADRNWGYYLNLFCEEYQDGVSDFYFANHLIKLFNIDIDYRIVFGDQPPLINGCDVYCDILSNYLVANDCVHSLICAEVDNIKKIMGRLGNYLLYKVSEDGVPTNVFGDSVFGYVCICDGLSVFFGHILIWNSGGIATSHFNFARVSFVVDCELISV